MAFADTQKLIVTLDLKGNFQREIKSAQGALGKLDARLSKTEGRAFRAGQQIGTGIKNSVKIAAVGVAALGTQVIAGLGQLAELEGLLAQTNAAIKSTGGVAGISAKDVRDLAEEYENLNATMDDKVIQSGENLLLTFTNIRKEAFEPALEAALNMSTALDQDLNTSVLQLGKALNDPTKGLTALRRVGVAFTKDQEKRIKQLQKEGKLYEAQKIILGELATEFGGRFAAGGQTAEGAIAGIGDAVEDLQKALATSLFPTIQKVLPKIREFLTSPAFVKGAEDLGKSIASLFTDENIQSGIDALKGFFETAKSVAPAIAGAAKITGEVVRTAVGLFNSLPPEIQKLAIGAFAINKITGGLVTNIAGGLISSVLKQLTAGVVNVRGASVIVTGGAGPGVPVAGAAAAGGAGKLAGAANLIQKVFIVGGLAEIANIIGPAVTQAGQDLHKEIFGSWTLSPKDLQWPFGPKNTPTILPEIFGGNGALGGTGAAPKAQGTFDTASVGKLQKIATAQNITNERLESIKGKNDAQLAAVHNSNSQLIAIQAKADATTAAAREAGVIAANAARGTTAAVNSKDLSVTVNPTPVNVTVRNIVKQTNLYKSIYRTVS